MPEQHEATTPKINKPKIYAIAFGIFVLVNFGFETCITLIENSTQQFLYPIFPFTRIGLLIVAILATNYYVRRRSGEPKQKLWWRIVRPILLILVVYGLTMGAWLSVANADADRGADSIKDLQQQWENLPVPSTSGIDTSNEAN